MGSLPNPTDISSRPIDCNKPAPHPAEHVCVRACLSCTHGSLCPICVHHMPAYDFAVRFRVYVGSWQPACPSNLAEYLLIWHGKKGGRPTARDYTDLRAHTHTDAHLLAHICTLGNAKPHTDLFFFGGGGALHPGAGISISLNFISEDQKKKKKSFERSSVPQKRNYEPTKKRWCTSLLGA